MSTDTGKLIMMNNQDDWVIGGESSTVCTQNEANATNDVTPATAAASHAKSSSKNRKRFDSSSTASSSVESCTLDTRFEAKPVSEISVKKSFLSTPEQSKCGNHSSISSRQSPVKVAQSLLSTASTTSQFASTATTQFSSTVSECFSVILCIASPNERDAYNNLVYRCFPPVEMILDDEKIVDSLVYEITAQLNEKLHSDLLDRYPNVKIPQKSLLRIGSRSEEKGDFELCQASKSGQPKGCSFDFNQQLCQIKCKSRLCLKVVSESTYDAILLQLLKKQTNNNKYGKGVNPIIEIEDDTHSIARPASLYKDSLMHREMEPHRESILSLYKNSSMMSSFQGKENLNSFAADSSIKQNVVGEKKLSAGESKSNPAVVKKKKISFWQRIFKCSPSSEVV